MSSGIFHAIDVFIIIGHSESESLPVRVLKSTDVASVSASTSMSGNACALRDGMRICCRVQEHNWRARATFLHFGKNRKESFGTYFSPLRSRDQLLWESRTSWRCRSKLEVPIVLVPEQDWRIIPSRTFKYSVSSIPEELETCFFSFRASSSELIIHVTLSQNLTAPIWAFPFPSFYDPDPS